MSRSGSKGMHEALLLAQVLWVPGSAALALSVVRRLDSVSAQANYFARRREGVREGVGVSGMRLYPRC